MWPLTCGDSCYRGRFRELVRCLAVVGRVAVLGDGSDVVIAMISSRRVLVSVDCGYWCSSGQGLCV
jgi:hypothetical protein